MVDKDGTPQIAGLGNTSIIPHSAAWTVDDRTSADRLSHGCAPELAWPPKPSDLTGPVHPTVVDDMYAFGVMAWEVRKHLNSSGIFQSAHSRQVLTGRPPFSEMTDIAAKYLMFNGTRPPRPHHGAISDRVWHMIECCWHNVPSERMSAEEVVNLLGKELGGMSGSRA